VSFKLTQATGQYHRRRVRLDWQRVGQAVRHLLRAAGQVRRRVAARTYAPPKLTLSVEECEQFLMETKIKEQTFDDHFAGHARFDLRYEQLVEDFAGTSSRLLDFLQVERQPLAYSQQPLNTTPLRNQIGNYDELAETFRDTPVAAYFDE